MLAIEGGRPIRTEMLSYGQQWIEEEDIQAVIDTMRSSYITQGPKIVEFEQNIARYVGAKYAVAFCNGTAALHAACYAAGLQAGDEVITSPLTFAASANCALYVGAKPVFVDIDERTYNLDPNQIEKAITSKTKAIIPVDYSGQPVDMDPIRQIAEQYGLTIIHDAAHSLGARYKGRNVGTLADMTMFSFHPVKLLTTGEGGMIVTDSEEYAQKLRLFRSHGITRENLLTSNDEPWFYEMQDLGYNYRITDIQAALGSAQLKRIDFFIERRNEIAQQYQHAFQMLDSIQQPALHPDVYSSWHLYVVRWKQSDFNVDRKAIFQALRAENIGVNVHYIPVYRHPYYQKLGYQVGLCPRAEQCYNEMMTLPLFPKMTKQDVEDVIEAVFKVYETYHTK